MMGKKFNLADFVQAGNVSESDTPEIVLLPWESIHGNAANFYAVDDVEELVNSISMHGLLDPVVVMADAEHPGEYVLISGHRRHKAWGVLREKEPEKWAQIPAIVRAFASPQLGELALIMANSAARKLTAPEISRQAERTEMLFYELKEQGYEFNGRMRDQVAAACQVSSTKLARLKVIREKLAECWKSDWEAGTLAENPAYELAKLPADFQARLRAAMRKPTGEQIERIAKLYNEGHHYDNPKDLQCPDGCLCQHSNAFLNHDAKDQYAWGKCYGETCCLKCDRATRNYSPCGSACAKAKAFRAAAKEEQAAKAEASRKREKTILQKSMKKSAARLLKALEAGSMADDEQVFPYSWRGLQVRDVRAIVDGSFCRWDDFYSDPMLPKDLSKEAAIRLSDLTGVTVDWFFGLTDYLWPAESAASSAGQSPAPSHQGEGMEDADDEVYSALAWQTGVRPEVDGRYLCLVDMGGVGDADIHEQMLDLKDEVWIAYGRAVDPDMFTVVAWWPLPKKWEPWMGDLRKEGEE